MNLRHLHVVRLWLAVLAACLLAACQRGPQLHTQESYVFGTRVEVLVWDAEEARARTAVAAVLREFDRLHRTYHAWQPSELSALNEAIAAGRAVEVSEELAGFAAEAKVLSARGDHLFDPGIGRLVALWGFHDDSFKPELPDPDKFAALVRARPSIADLVIAAGQCPPPGRPQAGTATGPEPRSGEPSSPPPPGRGSGGGGCISSRNRAVALDFGGYLKGVALDRAAAILRSQGIANALVNIGGNVMALGTKGERPWRVGIQDPRAPTPLATLDLRDGEAVGTSGDYQRFFELDGHRYSHLVDPRTGHPAEGTRAVTVLIAPRPQAGMWSDVASKPIFIAGAGWREMARRLDIAAVLRVDAAGRVEMTEAMQARLKMGPGS
ncbi:MAG: FAD:protein FMN transferase [Sterolibacteriaceae bacterium MAG5]|nr:FAD:protein FMN transferase [Candidatus Nitricoxidireducens bremensis]